MPLKRAFSVLTFINLGAATHSLNMQMQSLFIGLLRAGGWEGDWEGRVISVSHSHPGEEHFPLLSSAGIHSTALASCSLPSLPLPPFSWRARWEVTLYMCSVFGYRYYGLFPLLSYVTLRFLTSSHLHLWRICDEGAACHPRISSLASLSLTVIYYPCGVFFLTHRTTVLDNSPDPRKKKF